MMIAKRRMMLANIRESKLGKMEKKNPNLSQTLGTLFVLQDKQTDICFRYIRKSSSQLMSRDEEDLRFTQIILQSKCSCLLNTCLLKPQSKSKSL